MPKGKRGRASCSVEGCDRPVNGNGLCDTHNWRTRKWGHPGGTTPVQVQRHGMTPYERVMAQLVPDGDCLVFTGAKNARGYGHLGYKGRTLYAHRVVLEHHRGVSPLEAMHSCDTPACCRIEHLSYGTHAENTQDAVAKGRHFTPFRK